MNSELFSDTDREQMKQLGIYEAEAKRQLALFAKGPQRLNLVRPCTPGDGIVVLQDREQDLLLPLWEKAAVEGRLAEFIPASGAATRMFAFLQRIRKRAEKGTLNLEAKGAEVTNEELLALNRFIGSLGEFAFYEQLNAVMARAGVSLQEKLDSGEYGQILDFLLDPKGLNYGSLPKALIPFHLYSDHSRTALEEHLVEAIQTVRDARQRCRLHFTVSPEIKKDIEDFARQAVVRYGEIFEVEYELAFSVQMPATNTLAVDLENRPFRQSDGSLLFRPGGHGALLENLNRCPGDIVLIKNIDNVLPDEHRSSVVYSQRVLVGVLIEIQDQIHRYAQLLESGSSTESHIEEAVDFSMHRLNCSPPDDLSHCSSEEKASRLLRLLNRPLRVCGMVLNRGEPGGGPFWVRRPSGKLSLQIVESAQIDLGSPKQKAIFEASTHFNPVQIVCGLRDFQNRSFNLAEFSDPQAVFIARKTEHGRELKALELPGLWNGAMAYWNTVFVEIPEETFSPVKTINDLLRPRHRTNA